MQVWTVYHVISFMDELHIEDSLYKSLMSAMGTFFCTRLNIICIVKKCIN